MDNLAKRSPCSPYLRRPLRSLDQALKDQAAIALRDDEHRRKPVNQPALPAPAAKQAGQLIDAIFSAHQTDWRLQPHRK